MIRNILCFLCLNVFMQGFAYDCFVDGLYYDLDRVLNEATVTRKKEGKPTKEYKGEIKIPESIYFEGQKYRVTRIGKKAFCEDKQLTDVVIPNSVLNIGDGAFFQCINMKNILLPENLINISEWTFYNCKSLETIYIPRGVKRIGQWAFSNCHGLKSIILPGTVESIGKHTFTNCSSLESINIPPSVKDIDGSEIFYLTKGLKEVTVSEKFADIVKGMLECSPRIIISDEIPLQESPYAQQLADIDLNIPKSEVSSDRTFALVISNENYQHESNVPFANNDGNIFTEYMIRTLGIPKENIIKIEDATISDINVGINKLHKISEILKGRVSFIVYYAGHGIPDEKSHEAFLLPVDCRGLNADSGIGLNALYERLGKMNTNKTLVFLDACFSGNQRDGIMMQSSRGVKMKPKEVSVSGNTIVITASKGDETAHPYAEKQHGLFTYFLLKGLKESNGNISLGDLAEYVSSNVQQTSIKNNGELQTPTVTSSKSAEDWINWRLKDN